MKNLFVYIALCVGLAIVLALGAMTASLFISGVLITVLYILSGVAFASSIIIAIIGYIKIKKK